MIAKELQAAWWKVAVAAAGAMPAGLIVATYLPPYRTDARVGGRLGDEAALWQILNVYGGGGVALALLAILLGAATMSEAVDRGTIYLLLSKPAGRARILLTKYAVSSGILLSAAVFGHAMLVVAAIARGYPPGLLSAPYRAQETRPPVHAAPVYGGLSCYAAHHITADWHRRVSRRLW